VRKIIQYQIWEKEKIGRLIVASLSILALSLIGLLIFVRSTTAGDLPIIIRNLLAISLTSTIGRIIGTVFFIILFGIIFFGIKVDLEIRKLRKKLQNY